MTFETNYHTHSNLCDGKDSLEDMASSAYELGIKTLGFSGHSYTKYDESYCMSKEGTIEYINRIRNLQDMYKGKMNILLGIEQDFGSDEPVDNYDYVIGSVHALFNHDEENCQDFYGYDRSNFFCVDWSIERLREDVKSNFNNDPYAFVELYYEMVSKLPEVTNCDIIGHFDLVTKFIERDPWIDVNHDRYLKASDNALDILLKKNVIFEINTGAVARGYRTEPYPSTRILERLGTENARVVINSDTHSVDTITFGFESAYNLANKYHLNIVTI